MAHIMYVHMAYASRGHKEQALLKKNRDLVGTWKNKILSYDTHNFPHNIGTNVMIITLAEAKLCNNFAKVMSLS